MPVMTSGGGQGLIPAFFQAGTVIQYRQILLLPQEADSAQLMGRLGEQIKSARHEQTTLLNAVDLDLIATSHATGR